MHLVPWSRRFRNVDGGGSVLTSGEIRSGCNIKVIEGEVVTCVHGVSTERAEFG